MDADLMKAWQKGIALDRLKVLAAPFRVAHKPHVYGAFGLVKETAVAEALSEGRLLYTMRGDECAGAAIIRRLKVTSTMDDFAARSFSIPAGSVSLSAIAALDAAAADKLLTAVMTRADGAGLWVEIFEEDPVAKAAVERAGLRYQATKVMAGSEVKGLYATGPRQAIPDEPAEDATLLTVLPGFLSAEELAAIRGELAAFGEWAQHYSSYNKRESWTAFALRGYDAGDPTFIIKPAEMSRKWQEENPERLKASVADTSAFGRFPATRGVVDRLPGAKDRVRFMKLTPGKGELTRHADITDREAGLRNGLVTRMHIPIATNPGVRFQAWTKRGEHLTTNFPEAALCYLDQRKPHAVVNGGETERIHLVIDTRATSELRALIAAAAPHAATAA